MTDDSRETRIAETRGAETLASREREIAAPEAQASGVAAPELEAPLVLTSFPRSGSSLLRAMLHSHPEIAILPEPRWMTPLLMSLRGERKTLTRARAETLLGKHVDAAWLELAELGRDEVLALLPRAPRRLDVLAAAGRAYARRAGKGRWGLKNPDGDFRRRLPLVRVAFPRAPIVFLARDPRDVYLSQVKAGWRFGTRDLSLFCCLWVLQSRGILRALRKMGGPTLVVRYEDLVQDPRRTLRRTCQIAGLSDSDADVERMLQWRGDLHERILANPIHGNLAGPVLSGNSRNFERELTAEEIRRTSSMVASGMRALGYDVPAEPPERRRGADVAPVALEVTRSLCRNIIARGKGRSSLGGILRPGARTRA